MFEEIYYGVLVMVLCDDEGTVYDIWFTYDSMYEGKAYRTRKVKSKWFRELVECYEVYGDKAYKYVEGVIGAVKSFNTVSRWRNGITLLCYLYAYSVAYSFFREKNTA